VSAAVVVVAVSPEDVDLAVELLPDIMPVMLSLVLFNVKNTRHKTYQIGRTSLFTRFIRFLISIYYSFYNVNSFLCICN
jgi:hypothetical protein